MNRKNPAGFANTDLYIPVIILALLAAILVPNFVRARQQGQATACKSNLRNIATAVSIYRDEEGTFPEILSELSPEILRSLPLCPTNRNTVYQYKISSNPELFLIGCPEPHRVLDGRIQYSRVRGIEVMETKS